MLYLSEITGKTYSTVEELEKAELAAKEENEKKELLKAERKTRADEVEAAFKKVADAQTEANKLLDAFCKDYGAFHKTYRNGEMFPNFFDLFFRPWF